jgi:hypothetical protein
MQLRVASSEIISFLSAPGTVPRIWSDYVSSDGWPIDQSKVTLYFGQPDPNDAARFTIRYVVGEQSGLLAGRLNDDGTVTFAAKDGPLVGK